MEAIINPISWNYHNGGYNYNQSYYWINAMESFIFSLDDGKDLKKVKISRVTNNNYAIYEASVDGFCDQINLRPAKINWLKLLIGQKFGHLL